MAKTEMKWFDDQAKFAFEYFKYIAIFSISLVGLFGGFVRVVYPNTELPKDFSYGIFALGIVVVICVAAIVLIVFYDFFTERISAIGIVTGWLASTVGFFYGFYYLIKHFLKDIEIDVFLWEFGGLIVITVVVFWAAFLIYEYVLRPPK